MSSDQYSSGPCDDHDPCSLCWADLASLHSLLFLVPVSLLATATLAALAGGCCGCGAPGGY